MGMRLRHSLLYFVRTTWKEMGVKDLWKLLESAGRPVNVESLEGLVLAVGQRL